MTVLTPSRHVAVYVNGLAIDSSRHGRHGVTRNDIELAANGAAVEFYCLGRVSVRVCQREMLRGHLNARGEGPGGLLLDQCWLAAASSRKEPHGR